jgi:predicted  nucleic acid-binding Zn ribbon protein
MLVASVSFRAEAHDLDRVADRASGLLSCWYKNGQILGDSSPLADREGVLEAFVRMPELTSLDGTNDNVYARQALAQLLPTLPVVQVLGPEPDGVTTCRCSVSSALTFFTHYLSTVSPIRCLDCFGIVPLYRLPHVHDHEHLVLLQWAADYRACDTLQMHCTTGERFAEGQLSEHDSSLSRSGRALAADLERVSGTPVYYSLLKIRSRLSSELGRKCPSCDEPWRLEPALHGFDFQCRPCRLLSTIAPDAS